MTESAGLRERATAAEASERTLRDSFDDACEQAQGQNLLEYQGARRRERFDAGLRAARRALGDHAKWHLARLINRWSRCALRGSAAGAAGGAAPADVPTGDDPGLDRFLVELRSLGATPRS